MMLIMKYEQSLNLQATARPPVGGMTVANLKHKWLIDELIIKSKWSWDLEKLPLLINPRRMDKGRLRQIGGGK